MIRGGVARWRRTSTPASDCADNMVVNRKFKGMGGLVTSRDGSGGLERRRGHRGTLVNGGRDLAAR
jgi:hypothetical protein